MISRAFVFALVFGLIALVYFFLPRSEQPLAIKRTSEKKKGTPALPVEAPVDPPKAIMGSSEKGKSTENKRVKNDGSDEIKYKYWDKDKTKIRYETSMKNGQRHGARTAFYKSGSIKSSFPYEDGVAHGLAEMFYEDGLVEERYYPSGQLRVSEQGHRDATVGVSGDEISLVIFTSGDSDEMVIQTGKGSESHYAEDGTLTHQILHDGKGGSTVIYNKTEGVDKR